MKLLINTILDILHLHNVGSVWIKSIENVLTYTENIICNLRMIT